MNMLFALIVLASFAQAQQPWNVSKSVNTLTGVSTTIAITRATDFPGEKDRRPQLVARQSGNTCDLFVNVPFTVLSDTARVRYDSGKIESPGTGLASDSTAVFLKQQFAKIKTASKLVVEYTPSEQTPTAVTFQVHGLPAQFDSCVVTERKEIAAERKEAAEAAAREKDNAEMRASAEAQKGKELCEFPSFASDPKILHWSGGSSSKIAANDNELLQENHLRAIRELTEVGAAGADPPHCSAKNLIRVGLLRHRFLHRHGLNLLS